MTILYMKNERRTTISAHAKLRLRAASVTPVTGSKSLTSAAFGRVLITVFILCLGACGPLPDSREFLARDIHPPVFLGAGAPDERSFLLEFSEAGTLAREDLHFSPEVDVEDINWNGGTCRIFLTASMAPGEEYSLEAVVRDKEGNSLTLITHIFGYNPDVPEIRLNEITTQGSSSNPDKVELKVLSEGNTAGLCVYEGVDSSWAHRKVLPSVEVSAGQYIVVHFKPKGTEDEVDETEDPYGCSAEESVPGAWDYWIERGGGISGNNGVIAVYRSSTGPLIDGFLYSNRTSSSDENYRGFGSTRALERADRLHAQHGWIASERLVAPEDAVDPEDSTATRSMCRMPNGSDTDSSIDWHIVPTSGSTFGAVNNEEVYEP